jgi:hypothetical protein
MVMDETTAGPNPQSQHRTPFLPVGLILLGVVVVVLAGAFLLNQHFRSHVGIEPVARTATGSPSTPSSHNGGVVPATAQSTASAVSTSVPTVRPTPTLSPRQQVVEAYHRYWRDYSQALYTLNTSRMADVATGNELRRVEAEVATLRQRTQAVHVRVSHSALIVSIKGNEATVYDQQTDRSFLINPITKEPHIESVPPYSEKDIYFLQRIHGTWIVVKSLRQR